MRTGRIGLLAALLLAAMPAQATAQDRHYYQSDFGARELTERRGRIFDEIGAKAIALVQGAAAPNGAGPFRQSNEFYYLTGLDVPHAYLLLDGKSRRATLYLPHRNPGREANEGKVLAAEDAELVMRLAGVDAVRGLESLTGDLSANALRPPPPLLYTPLAPAETVSRDELLAGQAGIVADPWDGAPSREGRLARLIADRFPQFEVRDLSPALDALRTIKSPAEIAVIRRATQIAGLAIIEAMRSTAPGTYEYELDAAAKYVFFVNGARGEGYPSIIAGGTNAWAGHYYRKTDALRDGELLLMDYAPDYRFYTSDVARMWPVNGRYDPAQRALSAFILAYRDAFFRHIRPGVTSDQVLDAAAKDMERYLARASFAKPEHLAAAKASLAFRGHFQHPVGMSVHDVGVVRGVPLRAGMVFTIDPMIWIPQEKLYMRIEDVALVTADGVENLSAFVPSDLDAIERTIAEPGMVQANPATKQSAGDHTAR